MMRKVKTVFAYGELRLWRGPKEASMFKGEFWGIGKVLHFYLGSCLAKALTWKISLSYIIYNNYIIIIQNKVT